ncbi:Glutamate synthase [NADH], amyloplastic [Glycine soja]
MHLGMITGRSNVTLLILVPAKSSNKFWAFGGNVVAMDKDSCGVGFVAELSGESSRKTVIDALKMLVRMTQRGAYGVKPTLEME